MVLNILIYMHTFNFNQLEIYEIGAALAVIIAFPKYADEEKGRFHKLLCHHTLLDKYEKDGEWAEKVQSIKPIYAFYSSKTIQRDLNTINRQLAFRLQAGHMAIAFLKKINGDKLPQNLLNIEKMSLNQVMQQLDFGAEIDTENFQKRVWRESLPVIHLVSALAVYISDNEIKDEQISLTHLLSDKEMITKIIQEAESYENLFSLSKLQIDKDKLVKVRLVDGVTNYQNN